MFKSIKAIGRVKKLLFLINFGFYIKALSTNYKPILKELKNLI